MFPSMVGGGHAAKLARVQPMQKAKARAPSTDMNGLGCGLGRLQLVSRDRTFLEGEFMESSSGSESKRIWDFPRT